MILASFIAIVALSDVAESAVFSVSTVGEIIDGTYEAAGDKATDDCRAGFEAEVLDLVGVEDVKSNELCNVVGFSVPGTAEDVYAETVRSLEERGWIAVESGSGVAGSFIKETGEIRWLFMSCSMVGEETCVVLQTA